MSTRVIRIAIALATASTIALTPAASAIGPAPIALSRQGDLFTFRLGGAVHRLTETAARENRPAWAPSRRRLAFVSGDRQVGVLRTRTGATSSIAHLPTKFDEIQALAWSPDGGRIAIAANNWFKWHGVWRLSGAVWTVGADGGDLSMILAGQGMVTGLGWMPNGRKLLASTEWPNGVELWDPDAPLGVIAFADDGSNLRLVSETLASQLDVSTDGRRATYRGWSRTCHACGEIWRMATDGTGAHVIAMPPGGVNGLFMPRFSPAGTRIAVIASGRRSSLWVMHADGSGLHRVLTDIRSIDW
jgi:Tol biopolymer transport system component